MEPTLLAIPAHLKIDVSFLQSSSIYVVVLYPVSLLSNPTRERLVLLLYVYNYPSVEAPFNPNVVPCVQHFQIVCSEQFSEMLVYFFSLTSIANRDNWLKTQTQLNAIFPRVCVCEWGLQPFWYTFFLFMMTSHCEQLVVTCIAFQILQSVLTFRIFQLKKQNKHKKKSLETKPENKICRISCICKSCDEVSQKGLISAALSEEAVVQQRSNQVPWPPGYTEDDVISPSSKDPNIGSFQL